MTHINDIIIDEIICAFSDVALIELITVNKQLYNTITKYFGIKYFNMHKQCGQVGNDIDLFTFCNHYMRKIMYTSLNKNTSLLEYDYCRDCNSFSLQTIQPDGQKICKLGCIVICCDKTNIVPHVYNVNTKLICGCYITKRYIINGVNKCNKCSTKMITLNTKCIKCNTLPFRLTNADPIFLKYEKYKLKYASMLRKKEKQDKLKKPITNECSSISSEEIDGSSTSGEINGSSTSMEW